MISRRMRRVSGVWIGCALVMCVLSGMLAGFAPAGGEALSPEDIETLQKVESLNNENKCREAYRMLSPVLIAHSDLFITNYLMGVILQNTGNGVLAVRYYRRALTSMSRDKVPIDNVRSVVRDTYKRLFDIYTRTLFLEEADKLVAGAGKVLEPELVKQMKATLAGNKAALVKVVRPAPMTFSNAICTVNLPLPEGWVWLQWPDRDEQYEASYRRILKNGSLDIQSVLIRTLFYEEGVVTPADRELYVNSMVTAFAVQLKDQDNQVEEPVDTVIGGFKARTLWSSKMSGFMKLYDITSLIPLEKGLVFMVIPHRNKKMAEKVFDHCRQALELK